MRKIMFITLAFFAVSGFSACKEKGSGNGVSDFQSQLVEEFRLSSKEGNLKWNIPYRKALLFANRPMGCVFEYGVSFADFDQDSDKSEIWVHIGIIFPEGMIQNNQMKLHVDEQSFPASKHEVLRDAADGQIGDEINVYFKIPMKEFISSKRVCISLNTEKDLLISDKRTLNEQISSWHDKISKGKMKSDSAVLIKVVNF